MAIPPPSRVVVAAWLLAVSSGAAALAATAAPPSDPPVDDATVKLYTAKCQACHGAGGNSPSPGLSLADDKWIHGSSAAVIQKVIEDGVPGKPMVAFKTQFTKEHTEGLVRYVRSFSKKGKGDKKP